MIKKMSGILIGIYGLMVASFFTSSILFGHIAETKDIPINREKTSEYKVESEHQLNALRVDGELDERDLDKSKAADDPAISSAEVQTREQEIDSGKITFESDLRDTTGHGTVRKSEIVAGVDYRFDERTAVGIVATKELSDDRDALAWNRNVETEESATVQYKWAF